MANITTVSRPYARAVLAVAHASNSYVKWSEMLQYLTEIISNPTVNEFVRNLAVGRDQKAEFINGLDGGILNQQGKSLVKVLAHYKRLLIIPELYKLYEEMRKQQEREITAELLVAKEIASTELDKLQAEFAKDLQAKVTLQQNIDPSLIGGGKLCIGDRVLESSVKGNLKALYKELTQ